MHFGLRAAGQQTPFFCWFSRLSTALLLLFLLTGNTLLAQQSAAPIPNGLTNWYRAEGNALDTQGDAPTSNNGTGFIAGEAGQAFSFSGSSNIAAPASVGTFGTNDFTVDFWFNTTQAENFGSPIGLLGNRTDCSDGNFFGVRLYSGSTLFVELDEDGGHTNYNSVQTPFAVNDGQWHHVAIVRQGVTLSVYIDGGLVGSGQSAGITNITGANPFVMGQDACTAGYSGALDEIHTFNRALNQTEVQSIFNAGSAGLTTLVGWWNFNEGTGTSTGDLSGNGNIGTLSGTTLPAWTTDVPTAAFYHPAALSFDGVTSYVNVAGGATSSSLNFATQLSIAAWVKPATVPQTGSFAIISKPRSNNGTGWTLRMEQQDPNFALFNGPVNCTVHATSNPFSPGIWTHVAATYDSSTSTVQLYVNGTAVHVDIQSCSGPLTTAGAVPQPLEIAQEFPDVGSGREFPGLISDARVYNRVITASEIASLAGTVPPTSVTNCGTVITTSGKYQLANDLLNCPGDGIDIQATNVTLNLNGHTISGQFLGGTNGINVGGPAAGISNVAVIGPGTFTNFGGGGLGTAGVSYSLITGLTITGNAQGAQINQTFQTGNVRSMHNLFSNNTSTGNRFHGFTFNGGDQNTFTGNVATNNGQTGFLLFDAQRNTLNGNTASQNQQQGIVAIAPANGPGGFGNLIENNHALNNVGNDLEDDNVPCANIWVNNVFTTANQACVASTPTTVLTITAVNQTRFFGTANPPLTFTISGFINGDTSAVLSGAPAISTTAATNSPVGTYPITISQGTLTGPAYYTFQFVSATLQVYPGPLAPNSGFQEFLYAGTRDSAQRLAGWSIDPNTGSLAPVPGSPYSDTTGARAVVVDPSSQHLYVTSDVGSTVSSYGVNGGSGALSLLTPAFGIGALGTFAAAEDPTGRFLYVTSQFTGPQLFSLTIGSNGEPNQVASAVVGIVTPNPSAIVVHPSGKFLYITDANSGLISAYTLDPNTGIPTMIPPSLMPPTFPGSAAAMDPLGRFLYVAQANSGIINGFTINPANGLINPLGSNPVGSFVIESLAVDPTGRFLIASGTGFTQSFSINQINGNLTPTPGGAVSGGGQGAVVDPTGTFAYVGCGCGASIASFRIDPNVGALSPIGTFPAFGTNLSMKIAVGAQASGISLIAKPPTVKYGQPAELSASVTNPSTGTPVTSGTVTFTELGTNFSIGPVPVDGFGIVQVVTSTLPVGVHTITATYNAAAGVAGRSTTTTLTVTPALLTVTPNPVSLFFGDLMPTLTSTISGFVNNDTPAVVSGAAALTTPATSGTPPGTYAIFAAPGSLSAANYAFTFAIGTLTVNSNPSVTLPAATNGVLSDVPTGTYATPFSPAQNGYITNWQMEFEGGTVPGPGGTAGPAVPAGVQLKVFRSTGSGLQVVAQGAIHDPRPILQQKFGASYPNFLPSDSATTFNESPIPVLQGDLIGITVYADPALNAYALPLLGTVGTYTVAGNVVQGQTLSPSNPTFRVIATPPLSFTLFPSSSSNPLTLMNNYFVTGDYSVGSTSSLRGTGVSGTATGQLSIPRAATDPANGIPDGADIMGAFLYWEVVENTPLPSGAGVTFDGYSVGGQQVGNDAQYTEVGISGTLRVYRADVLPYFALSNGVRAASGQHTVTLPDGGNALPFGEGATLVVIYRVMSPNFPLKAVVLYDGSAVSTSNNNLLQVVQGFYDAAGIPANSQARVTNIFSSGGTWATSTNSVPLLSGSQYGATLPPGAWGGIVLSTLVNNSDNDGILDAWKAGPPAGDFHAGQPGYYDAKLGQWIPLPGAARGQKDLFVQMDYMCSAVLTDGTCAPGSSELPMVNAQGQDPMLMLQQVFANHGIALHLQIGNAIQAETCTDSAGQLCQFPNEPGVVDWKLGHEILKVWPRNPLGCAFGGDCSPRFAYGAKDSYHYVLMADSLAIPEWNTTWGTLTAINVATNGSQTTATISTSDRGTGILACPARISITGALGNPGLNGVYNAPSCPDSRTMIVNAPGVSPWSYPNAKMAEPVLGITSGTINSISGFSDLGGADTVVSLGKWETSPNQDMSKRVNVQVGTILHEIGHTLGLSHGGTYFDNAPNSYRPTIEANCKPNYQSVMNYMFQIDLLGPNHALELSNQQLPTINEGQASSYSFLSNVSPTYPTSRWYVPAASNPTVSPATAHCDGTALTPGISMFRIDGASDGSVSPGWANGQDVNYDGQLNNPMRGYSDWGNVDLRQIGATSGQFVELADLLQFGNIGSSLNVGAGGNVTLGSGGNVILGSGGNVTLGSGGSATLSSGGTVTLGSGGTVTLGSGGTVALGSAGTITMGSGGNVILGSGGNVTLGSGGTITLGSGGTVALGSGGNVTLGSGGTILLGSGGTVTVGAGGTFTLDGSGGTIVLGAGGNVTLGSGGNVTLGSGGTITLGSGGNVTLGSGGTVALGSGGTIAMGSGGNVIVGSGGTVTLGSGGTITLGSGGNVTLGSGGAVTLGSGGTVTLGSGGNVTLGSGGNVTLGSGGNVTLGSGGNVALGSGGNVTLGSAGTIALGTGGTVTLGSGGNVTLGSAGTVALGSGGNITLGSGGTITLGSGGNVTLGSGGNVALGSGGNIVLGAGGSYTGSAGDVITIGAGGNITLGSGGTISLSSGGNVTLGSGGTITLGSGGNVTLGSGGTVTLGSGGNITLGSGGNVTLGSGGNVTLGSGGNVTLGSGGTVALGSGGNVTLGSGGTVTLGSGGNTILGSGGNVTLGSGGTVALGSGGNVTLGSGGTLALGSGGNVTLGSGGTVALGSGGNITLGSGGTIALGSGGVTTAGSEGGAALGSGGVVTSEMSYEIANSIVRPPESPTATPTTTVQGAPAVLVNWTAPAFGVVTQYTIYRSDNGGTPVQVGTVVGNPPSTTFLDANPSGAGKVAYTISTSVNDPNSTTPPRQSPPSVPAMLTQTITFPPLPNSKVGDNVPVNATASSGLPVVFTTSGNCFLAGALTAGQFLSPNMVNASATGGCTVTATQAGNDTFASANVSQTFAITTAATKSNETISFQPLGNQTFGVPNFTLLALASSNLPVSYTTMGQCIAAGNILQITGIGGCTVIASQAGNNNFNPAASVAQSFMINPASTTTTVASSVNPSSYFQMVTLSAYVCPQFFGTPTGSVTFYDGVTALNGQQAATLGSAASGAPTCPSGATPSVASFDITTLQAGSHSITASYSGDSTGFGDGLGNFTASSTTAALTQTVNQAAVAQLNPLFVAFGNQKVNSTSSPATITLSNIGDAALNISPNGISIVGPNASEFAIASNNCGSSVAAGGSCKITVTFTPVDTGIANASLQFADNNNNSSSQQTVSLTGAGLSAISSPGSLYSYGIFAQAASCGAITLSGNSLIDSFNSTLGYPASDVKSGGNVGTNGNVTLNGNVSVYGSAAVQSPTTGKCSSNSISGLTSNGNAKLTGGLVSLNGPVTYPTPPAPVPAPPTTNQTITLGVCPQGMTGCTNGSKGNVTLAPGQYGNVSVLVGTTVHLTAGTYNVNSFTLVGLSTLHVDSGPVIMNLAGASLSGSSPVLDLSGGTMENPTGSPSNLQFVYAGSRGITLVGGTLSSAAIYAPNAVVNMAGGIDYFGSITAGTVTNSGGTAVHYDKHLPAIAGGSYFWFAAVMNNVSGLKGGAQAKIYVTNASIQYSVDGVLQPPVPVPNSVVTLNAAQFATGVGASTTYDLANSRWSTAVGAKSLSGNTFVTGIAIPVPAAGLPDGIQNVQFSAAFTTDVPGLTLNWQWGAAVYTQFNPIYATSSNANVLGINPEDGSANLQGNDPAGTPESYKTFLVPGATGSGGTNYVGYLSTSSGVVPTSAPVSASPSNLNFGTQIQGTTSGLQGAVITNNDTVAHNFITPSGATGPIYVTGTNAADFKLGNGPNNCVGMPSLAPGASCTVYVSFSPTFGGGASESAKVVVNTDAINSPQTVFLSGTGQ